MLRKDNFLAVNIREYLALGTDDEAGEPALIRMLSGFSCPKNPDVEWFLKNSAIAIKILYHFCTNHYNPDI